MLSSSCRPSSSCAKAWAEWLPGTLSQCPVTSCRMLLRTDWHNSSDKIIISTLDEDLEEAEGRAGEGYKRVGVQTYNGPRMSSLCPEMSSDFNCYLVRAFSSRESVNHLWNWAPGEWQSLAQKSGWRKATVVSLLSMTHCCCWRVVPAQLSVCPVRLLHSLTM